MNQCETMGSRGQVGRGGKVLPVLLMAGALPAPGVALNQAEIKAIFAQGAAKAAQLGVNCTMSMTDREGNILGCVRTTNTAFPAAKPFIAIDAGGQGGLEGVLLPSTITTTSKAGTAAFLSTRGNAFSTRTAGFIIQTNFPAGIRNQPAGPLFGVQLSSLPTSDLNRLPLGLAADPGGLPLYRGSDVLGGFGVEVDGFYTAPASRIGQSEPTDEERITAAGCAGYAPPDTIRADNILVGGVRFAFAAVGIPGSPEFAADFDTLVAGGQLRVLTPVRATTSADTMFVPATLGTVQGDTIYGFQQSYVEAVAVRGDDVFIITPNASLVRSLSRVSASTGTITPISIISGSVGDLLPIGNRVSAMALDDLSTPATTDDLLYVFDATSHRVLTIDATTGGVIANVPQGLPNAEFHDAFVATDGVRRIVAITDENKLFVIDPAAFASPGSFAPVNIFATLSIASGESGVFAVGSTTATPPNMSGSPFGLFKISLAAATSTLVSTNIAPLTNERVRALAYDNNGTAADLTDDALLAQDALRGTSYRFALATNTITAAKATIGDPRFVLREGRFVNSGGTRFVVGVSQLTNRLARINTADVTQTGNLTFLTGVNATSITRAGMPINGQQLTAAEAQTILTQAHKRNSQLRAAIRKDRPQKSQVSVSVCDQNGNLLGVFRTPDAPIFGFDVSLQKARSAMFLSRPDCAATLNAAENGLYQKYTAACAAYKVPLNGSIALSETSVGFIARPTYPDGIPETGPGPLSALAPDKFSPFNTGIQTDLILSNVFRYAFDYLDINDDGIALGLFDQGLIGTPNVVVKSIPLQNGLQIFSGAIPLYKNGVLVGAVGVSGDGIEQDADIGYAGAQGFQKFGPGVTRADGVRIEKKLRLPYVKLPRRPSGGF